MQFLKEPAVIVTLVILMLGGGVWVVSRWGKLGGGTGGVTGKPGTPPSPYGNKQPGGYKPPTPPQPPKEQL